jgi:hypothetical protein
MTTVTFYEDELNIDYVIPHVRIQFGDYTGESFSDTIIRSTIIGAVKTLERRWNSKYQVYHSNLLTDPQPDSPPAGYVYAQTQNGDAYIPSGLSNGDVFRNPYIDFDVGNTTSAVFLPLDETAVILQTVYLLHKVGLTSSADDLVSWSTEDIRFTNLSKDRAKRALLEDARAELDNHFKQRLGTPKTLTIPKLYRWDDYNVNFE